MKRIAFDITSQAAPLVTSFLDRLVLTGILVRSWGVGPFEFWSLALSAAAFLAILDTGCMMNFSNAITREVELGDRARAVRLYRQSNTIFLSLGLIAALLALLVASSGSLQSALGVADHGAHHDAFPVIAALGLHSALKLTLSNIAAIYRAELDFARVTLVTSGLEAARIIAVGASVLAGVGLAGAALCHLSASLVGFILIFGIDVARRHPDFRYRLAVPRRSDLEGSMRGALLFSLPYFPHVAMMQGPVLLLGGATATGSGVIAMFVLMRTLANFARSLLIKVTNVLGMEIARHSLRGDEARAQALLGPVGYLAAIAFGCCAAGLAYHGHGLVRLWTGRDDLFDGRVILLLLVPMLVTPGYLLALAFVQYRDTPLVWTVCSYVQLILAVLIYAATPGLPLALRIALALSLGELLGAAIPVAIAATGGPSLANFAREAGKALTACSAFVATLLLAWVADRVVPASSLAGLAFGVATIGAAAALALLAAAVPAYRAARLNRMTKEPGFE